MRILVVADEYPWPPHTGYRQRLRWVLHTLAAQGTVDFLAIVLDEGVASQPPAADVPLSRCTVVATGFRPEPLARRLRRWTFGRAPRTLLRRHWTAPRRAMAAFADTHYDLVWFSHAHAYLALRDMVVAPHVVDLDNLESAYLGHRLRRGLSITRLGLRESLVAMMHAMADGIDQHRWRRLEHQIVDSAAVVVVCSQLDRDRLGRPNVLVVRNGYQRASDSLPPDRPQTSPSEPVFIMVGLMTYEPNRDAAAFFAAEIFPRVRLQLPDAKFLVVGRYGSESDVAALRGVPGVVIRGEVDDVGSELANANVAVVPIRFGGGTRIKILEAFAYRIPVVSTSVGCEGLDVADGEHLLIADDPAEFASACVRAYRNTELRANLVTKAAQLQRSRYRWTAVTPAIVDVLRAATGSQGG